MEREPFLESGSSSSEENETVDQDVGNRSEIENEFTVKYCISSEESISLKKEYLLHLDKTKLFDKVAVGASNGVLYIFDVNSGKLKKSTDISNVFGERQLPTCGVKFLKDNENLVLVGITNGRINLYDLRTNQKEYTYEDIEGGRGKPIICFDVNANSRILCAGTNQIENESYVLFFDLRQKAILGGYWDSHEDDVTAVKFHPTNPDCLTTGSTDGLINVFDIAENTEDEALKFVMNNGSGVQELNWHKNVYNKDVISCIADINHLNIYDAEGDILSQFSRSDVTRAVKRTSVDDCVLINCHNDINGSIFLLAGTNFHKGEMLRSVHVNNKKLIPHGNFDGNKQIIRNSIYCPERDILMTIGESAIVSLWKRGETKVSYNWKITPKDTKNFHKQKPY